MALNTYKDWAVVPRPIISVCLHLIDRKVLRRRAAEFDLELAEPINLIHLGFLQGVAPLRIAGIARCNMENTR